MIQAKLTGCWKPSPPQEEDDEPDKGKDKTGDKGKVPKEKTDERAMLPVPTHRRRTKSFRTSFELPTV